MGHRSVLVSLGVVALAACDAPNVPGPAIPSLELRLRGAASQRGVVAAIPAAAQDPARVALGKALFFDKILSGNRDVSCATCHDMSRGAADGLSLAVGTGGVGTGLNRAPGPGRSFLPRSAPSLLGVSVPSFYLMWDATLSGNSVFMLFPTFSFPQGLSGGLAAQAMLPVMNRAEMRGKAGDLDVFGAANELAVAADSVAGVWSAVMLRVLAVQAYKDMFAAAYPGVDQGTLGFQHAANAIAAFEIAALDLYDSPWNRFLKGDDAALSPEEKEGGMLFFTKGNCAACHTGSLMGGSSFHNIGVPQLGPGVGVHAPLDRGVLQYPFAFRTPPLRNVELSAPYMHNGAYPTLEAVVRHYTNPDSALTNYDPTQVVPALRPTVHSDAATLALVRQTLDTTVKKGVNLTATEQTNLVKFLKAFTDPAAKDLSSIVPVSVPSGLPIAVRRH